MLNSRQGVMTPGPAFISCELRGTTGDGGATLLRKITNPEDIAKLVVLDTWIRNSDRHAPWLVGQVAGSNLDNLFFRADGRKFELIAFDHSHCFVETTLEPELFWQGTTTDDRIYGNFPSFNHTLHTIDSMWLVAAYERDEPKNCGRNCRVGPARMGSRCGDARQMG